MLALIVAYTNNRVIGNNGCIPWKIAGEQKRFRELTTNNVIIMGRKTYEEIGRPLPNRTTIVVSNTKNFDQENCYTAKSLTEAINMFKDRDIFISGGQRLYKEAIDIVDKMYITKIDMSIDGDTYFPEFDESLFIEEVNETFTHDISYTYYTYTRK